MLRKLIKGGINLVGSLSGFRAQTGFVAKTNLIGA